MQTNLFKGRLLIVDDDPAICKLLSETLRQAGFEVAARSDGKTALDLLDHEAFDAIISDQNMPGITGLQLLEEVRKRDAHLVFLMATGVDDIRVGVQAMKQGADDYLVKPFQFDAVVASLQRAMEKRRLEREIENYRLRLEDMVEQRTKQLGAAMKRIELTYDETLEALGAALDLRDNETAGHCGRVTLYCLEMAKPMGCPEEELRQIARGAYLHDIGKIGIPDAILLKPGKLTEAETAIMQAHAQIGYELVSRIAFLAPAAQIVLTHQERFDGTGYPQGLQGKEIPLGARIFAVADTLDAMMSDRPYRRALPFSTAEAEIKRFSGRQFDPDVVKAFLAIPEQNWELIRCQVGISNIRRGAFVSAKHESTALASDEGDRAQ
jgi:response regulator RpfG family c-di-GMP phosphodiesterase